MGGPGAWRPEGHARGTLLLAFSTAVLLGRPPQFCRELSLCGAPARRPPGLAGQTLLLVGSETPRLGEGVGARVELPKGGNELTTMSGGQAQRKSGRSRNGGRALVPLPLGLALGVGVAWGLQAARARLPNLAAAPKLARALGACAWLVQRGLEATGLTFALVASPPFQLWLSWVAARAAEKMMEPPVETVAGGDDSIIGGVIVAVLVMPFVVLVRLLVFLLELTFILSLALLGLLALSSLLSLIVATLPLQGWLAATARPWLQALLQVVGATALVLRLAVS